MSEEWILDWYTGPCQLHTDTNVSLLLIVILVNVLERYFYTDPKIKMKYGYLKS